MPLHYMLLINIWSLCCVCTSRWFFWSDSDHHSIEKASMDGKNHTVIVESNLSPVVTLTLDYQAQVLYWIQVDPYLNKVESSSIDGMNRQTILSFRNDITLYHGVSLFRDILLLSGSYGIVYMANISSQNVQPVTIACTLNCFSSTYQPSILKVFNQERQPVNCKLIILHIHVLERSVYDSMLYSMLLYRLQSLWHHKWRM